MIVIASILSLGSLGFLEKNGFTIEKKDTHPSFSIGEHFSSHIFNSTPQQCFQERYGDPNKASLVFVFYCALKCPDCIKCYKEILPYLKTLPSFKEGKMAFVVRDYPYNPLSLKATVLAWSVPGNISVIHEKFFEALEKNEKGILNKMDEEDVLPIFEEIALQEAKTPEEKNRYKTALNNQALLKRISECRQKDKRALGIEEVPSVFLVIKKNTDPKKWKVIKIEDMLDTKNLSDLIEKYL